MRKELVCYVTTNEEGEECKVQRVADDPNFFLFTMGQNRMVLNIHELMDAVGTIGHYSTLFDQEAMMRAKTTAAPAKAVVVEVAKPVKKGKKVDPEDEGALILEAQNRTGPTASELALEKQMSLMKGDTIVITEKK